QMQILRGHSGALGGIWGHSVARKERGDRRDRRDREGRGNCCFFALFVIFAFFASHFSVARKWRSSISPGALRFCDDKSAAGRLDRAESLGKGTKIFSPSAIFPRGGA